VHRGADVRCDVGKAILSGQTAAAGSAFEDAPQADASIDKEAVVDPIVAGEDASFTVTVHAGGTGASENVVLTDLNDTGHGWTVAGTDAGDCVDTQVPDGETLTCNFGDVPNGEDRTVTITMTSDEGDCALGIANTASVASSNDHDASNNEDSDSITERDYPAIQGINLVVVTTVVSINLLVDLVYAWLDPRIRY